MERLPKEQIKKDIGEILEGQYPVEAVVIIGENRGQLFVRIPQFVKERLNLSREHKLLFRVITDKDKKSKLSVEVYNEEEEKKA